MIYRKRIVQRKENTEHMRKNEQRGSEHEGRD